MCHSILRVTACAALVGLSTTVAARNDGLPSLRVLPTDLALEVAREAQRACARQGFRVAVAVVDRAGVLLAQLRDEAAGPHTVDSTLRKAYTAASFRIPSAQFMNNVNSNPAAHGLRDLDRVIALAGGLPIQAAGEFVGGVGVGGAPGGDRDEVCAQAGLDSILDILPGLKAGDSYGAPAWP